MPIIVFPVTLIFFPQTSALIIALLTGIFSSSIVAYELRSITKVNFGIIKTIIPTSTIGIIIGAYTLSIISKGTLQIFLGLSIIILLNVQKYFLPNPKGEIKIERKLHLYGLLSGFFKSTVGLSAGPLLVWIRFYIVKPNQVRVLMAYYFITMNSIAIISIQVFENKALTNISFYLLMLLLPIIFIANYLGSIIANKVSEAFYNQLAYFALMVAGIVILAMGLKGYL